MTGVKIEIERDPDAKSEGDTIIRLLGVTELPEDLTFRIEPLDEDAGEAEQPGWPSGDLEPLRARLGEKGVEFIVGPGVVDAPALLPGTPLAVVVPGASLREELRWPSLPAVRVARSGVVVMSAERRRAEIAARAKARRKELEQMAAVRLAAEANVAEVVPQNIAANDGLSRLEVRRKGNIKLVGPADDEAREQDDVIDEIAAAPTEPHAPPPLPSDIEPAELRPSRPPAPPLPNFYPSRQPGHAPAPAAREGAPPPLPTRTAAPRMGGMQPMSDAPPLPSQSPRFLTQSGPVRRDTGDMQRAFGLGFLVAAVLAVISSFVLTGSVSGLFRSKGDIAAKSSVAAMTASSTALGEILAVPPTSVRGVDARSVDLGEALKRADLSLHSDNGGDKEEAQYWLRRALALGLGDQRLVWAMTQLGTMYASPATGAPDYGAARSLWELAAAQSDPVAMCFLASLHEHGLGGARDPAQALYLYRRAKAKGGCRNVDQSIARLAKAAP